MRDLKNKLEAEHAASAKNMKSYEKLREKYVTLKNRETELENRVIQIR